MVFSIKKDGGKWAAKPPEPPAEVLIFLYFLRKARQPFPHGTIRAD